MKALSSAFAGAQDARREVGRTPAGQGPAREGGVFVVGGPKNSINKGEPAPDLHLIDELTAL
jgi:hypothetical protein